MSQLLTKKNTVSIFDSTLRDGAQGEGISFSVSDKLHVLEALDNFGVGYVEAGNPFSNPKDLEFFKKAKQLTLRTAKLVAFGSTRKKGVKAADDANLQSLLSAETGYAAVFGKCWDLHATEILGVPLSENLDMIHSSVEFLKNGGVNVFFDAEHFFDGYKKNSAYALEALSAAADAGAAALVLCDTNGGCFPFEIAEITAEVVRRFPNIEVGIHCHNDCGCAAANSVAAVRAGATQVQGTFIGIGERTGNANLSVIIPNLQLKLGYSCVAPEKMPSLTETAHAVAECANAALPGNMPYVGKSAFAHKAGMHADGVAKNSGSFEHLPPESVGNNRNFLLSEVAGRTSVLQKITDVIKSAGISGEITKSSPIVGRIADKLKQLEFKGYQFEAADASFKLMVLRELGEFKRKFEVQDFKIVTVMDTKLKRAREEGRTDADMSTSTAMVKVKVGGEFDVTAAEGDGPVNAMDKALRKALGRFFGGGGDRNDKPNDKRNISDMRLTDYKVRIIDSGANTAAVTRVLIESTDGHSDWTTVGVSDDIISASMMALIDSIDYFLL